MRGHRVTSPVGSRILIAPRDTLLALSIFIVHSCLGRGVFTTVHHIAALAWLFLCTYSCMYLAKHILSCVHDGLPYPSGERAMILAADEWATNLQWKVVCVGILWCALREDQHFPLVFMCMPVF